MGGSVMSLGENLKIYRKEARLTQKALAEKSGLSFSMVSKLENGEQTNPSYETMKKMADVLKISPAELLASPLSIEAQIDDYIEYKRGLKKSDSISAEKKGAPCQDELCADLNFRKKMQAINNMPEPAGYIQDDSLDEVCRRPEMKRLFQSLQDATSDEIIQVTRFVEAFRRA